MVTRMSAVEAMYEGMLFIDLYRRPFLFMLSDDYDKYRTFWGGCFSIITVMLVLTYGSIKYVQMTDLQNYQLLDQEQEKFYSENDTFTSEDGFHVAAGVVSLKSGGSPESVEDPEIGTVKMYLKSWNMKEDAGVQFEEISTSFCEKEDFNDIDDSNEESKFFPPTNNSVTQIDLYGQ